MISRIKTGGRIAGTPNKRTQDLQQRLETLGVDPVAGLAAIAKDDTAPLEIRARVQMELMAYLYPKRKSLEAVNEKQQPVSIHIGIRSSMTPSPMISEVFDSPGHLK